MRRTEAEWPEARFDTPQCQRHFGCRQNYHIHSRYTREADVLCAKSGSSITAANFFNSSNSAIDMCIRQQDMFERHILTPCEHQCISMHRLYRRSCIAFGSSCFPKRIARVTLDYQSCTQPFAGPVNGTPYLQESRGAGVQRVGR